MRALPPAFAARLEGDAATLATLWRVDRRDGRALLFTDHDRDLELAGEVYRARTGFRRSAIASEIGFVVGDLEVEGLLDSAEIAERDLRGGLFDGARVLVSLCDWRAPEAGAVPLRRGTLGEVRLDERGRWFAELRGLAQALQQRVGEVYTAECRAELGDKRCRVPLEPPVLARGAACAAGDWFRVPLDASGTRAADAGLIWRCVAAGTTAAAGNAPAPPFSPAGGEVADGTARFAAAPAWTVGGAVESVNPENHAFAFAPGLLTQARQAEPDYFALGVVVFEGGDNAGAAREVLSHDPATRVLRLFTAPPYPMRPGDPFRVSPGCPRTREACRHRFGNLLNMRAEPYVPGADALLQVGR